MSPVIHLPGAPRPARGCLPPARPRALGRATCWSVLAAAVAFGPAPANLAGTLSELPPRDAYQPIVERDPFVPYYRPAQPEEAAPAPEAPPPAADREFYIQAIVTGLDGQLRASVQEKDAPPTRLLRQGESQSARPEEGQAEAIEVVSIDPKTGVVVITSAGKSYTLSLKENVAELPKGQVARAQQSRQQQQIAQAAAAVNNPNLRRQPGAPGSPGAPGGESQDPAERARQMAAELAARRAERLQRLREMRDSGQLENLQQLTPPPPPPSPTGVPGPPDAGGGGPPPPG